MYDEEILDFSGVTKEKGNGKILGYPKGHSSPKEQIYQKRYDWWVAHGFGESPARWAASWRLGMPKKVRNLKPGEDAQVERALRAAAAREVRIRDEQLAHPKRKLEKIINDLDKRLTEFAWDRMVQRGYTKWEANEALRRGKIDANIFYELS